MRSFIPNLCGLLLLGLLFATLPAQGQRTDGAWGIGGQIGSPSGITVKLFHAHRMSYDVLAAWDLNDFFYLNVHGLYERPVPDVPKLAYFFGPGAFVGFRDQQDEQEVALGVSVRGGLNYMVSEAVEVYLQITPRISVIPDTEGGIGGGLGFRYYF